MRRDDPVGNQWSWFHHAELKSGLKFRYYIPGVCQATEMTKDMTNRLAEVGSPSLCTRDR